MADDGKIVIGLEGNPAGINKALDDVEKKGQKTAQSVNGAFTAIGGALAGAGIIASFKGAFEAANRLDASLARVTSSAKAFGLSTGAAKRAALDLAKDGFLSLNQSASALSNLMSTGLNIDQSKKFIEASKNIAAYGNTVGDAASSIESGIKGIITGSSELVENMSPAMKKLSMAFTENKNKVGEAKAVQELYNGVIKLGTQYAGDAASYLDTAEAAQKRFSTATEAASAAVGKSLQPALKGLYNILTGVVDWFTKLFSGLDAGVQTVIVMVPLIAALVISIASAGKAMVALGIVSASTWAAILGPLTLIISMVALVGLAVKELYNEFKKGKGESLVGEKKALEEQIAALEKAGKKTQELSDAKEKLTATNEALVAQYGKYLKALNLENASLETKLSLYKRIDDAEKRLGGKESITGRSDAEIRDRIKHSEDEIAKGRGLLASGTISSEKFDEVSKEYTDEIFYLKKELEGRKTATPTATATGAKRPEQRFLESQQKLAEIELNRIDTIKKAEAIKDADERKRRQMRAYEDAELLAKAEVNSLRSAYAEYIEDKAMADKLALDKQTDDAIRAVRLQEEAGELIKEQAERRIQKIREANARKAAELAAKSFAETIQSANAIVSGFGSLATAKTGVQGLGATGSILSGVGGISEKFKSFGFIGQGLSAATGIISTLQGIFEKSDEQRAEEARVAENQRKEQLVLLELQANYQKNLLALSEASAKLPFENLQRKMRLADIEASAAKVAGISPDIADKQAQEKKLAAVNSTIASEGGKIAQGALFGDVAATPDSLIAFLSQRAAQQLAVAQFVGLVNTASQYTSTDRAQVNPGPIQEILSQMASYSSLVPPELYNAGYGGLQQYLSAWQNFTSVGSGGVTQAQRDRYFAAQAAFNAAAYSGPASRVSSLSSEITSDTSIAENLLSTFEQSNQLQLEIAGNTKKTADNTNRLTNMKESNILDLVGGGIRGFGSFFRGAFNSVDSLVNPRMPALATPSAISSSLSVASLTRSWQDRAADGIENLVKIQTEALRLLAEIAMNSDAQGQVQGSMTSAQLQDIMANIRSRIV